MVPRKALLPVPTGATVSVAYGAEATTDRASPLLRREARRRLSQRHGRGQCHHPSAIGNLATVALTATILHVDTTPEVFPITNFRRDAARIVGEPVASGRPSTTQCGHVTAVVLSRERYRDLLHRLELLAAASARVLDSAQRLPGSVDEAAARLDRAAVDRARDDLVSAARRRRQGLVETRFGVIDAETADLLEAEGSGSIGGAIPGRRSAGGAQGARVTLARGGGRRRRS
jgi:hypothetical protein